MSIGNKSNTKKDGRRERRFAEAEEDGGRCLRLRERPKVGRLLVQCLDSSSHGISLRCGWSFQAQVLPALYRMFLVFLFLFIIVLSICALGLFKIFHLFLYEFGIWVSFCFVFVSWLRENLQFHVEIFFCNPCLLCCVLVG